MVHHIDKHYKTGNMMNYKYSVTGKPARLASWAYLKCVAVIKWKGISE